MERRGVEGTAVHGPSLEWNKVPSNEEHLPFFS